MSVVPHVPHSPYRAVRAVRAALFAVVCVGVGATLHAAAGGCGATWSAVGLAVPAVWVAAWFGLARERSWPALTLGLGLAQVGLHLLFTWLGPGAATAHATAAAIPNHAALTTAMPDMAGMTMMPQPSPYSAALTMITTHALAVVICGWWLGQGERDFFALWRAAGALAATPLRRLAEAVATLAAMACRSAYAVPHALRAVRDDGPRQRPAPLLTALTFRGPPAVA